MTGRDRRARVTEITDDPRPETVDLGCGAVEQGRRPADAEER